jgi:hypothetical protein
VGIREEADTDASFTVIVSSMPQIARYDLSPACDSERRFKEAMTQNKQKRNSRDYRIEACSMKAVVGRRRPCLRDGAIAQPAGHGSQSHSQTFTSTDTRPFSLYSSQRRDLDV